MGFSSHACEGDLEPGADVFRKGPRGIRRAVVNGGRGRGRRYCGTPRTAGLAFTEMDRVRYRRDKAFIARLCVQAVNRLFEASGAHAVLESDPIQRFHRDVHGASHHAALTWDPPAEQFGRQALGVGKSP